MTRAHLHLTLAAIAALAAAFGTRVPRSVEAQTPALPPAKTAAPAQLQTLSATSQPIARTWTPPDMTKIPAGPRGESILLGMRIFQETPRYAAKYVGNKISCGNCHIQVGTLTGAMPLVGAPDWFPQYSERAKRMITLEDRIQECVTRSENGTPLPHDGPEMRALFDFFDWLTESCPADKPAPLRGLPALPDSLQADLARGEKIYTDKCAACHGADGAGVPSILPPLWGPGAYNDGAGMNQPQEDGRLRLGQHAAE